MPDDINTPPRTVVTTSNRAPRAIPERDADPARGLVPPSTRTPETDEGKELTAIRKSGAGSLFQGPLVRAAIRESFKKLDPRAVARNPVMFVVEVGAAITTIVLMQQVATRTGNIGFTLQITLWLWFTVVFANFAEAMAEARGRAQVDTLRATRKETPARRIRDGREEMISSSDCVRATSCWSVKTRSFLATVKSSKAWPTSTRRPSPANPRRS